MNTVLKAVFIFYICNFHDSGFAVFLISLPGNSFEQLCSLSPMAQNLFHAHGVKTVFNLPNVKTVLTGDERIAFLAALQSLYAKVFGNVHVLKTMTLNILRLL
ncbi:hypothetical protein BH10BAC3_BH10BAC3_16730 [soil metagenome]